MSNIPFDKELNSASDGVKVGDGTYFHRSKKILGSTIDIDEHVFFSCCSENFSLSELVPSMNPISINREFHSASDRLEVGGGTNFHRSKNIFGSTIDIDEHVFLFML